MKYVQELKKYSLAFLVAFLLIQTSYASSRASAYEIANNTAFQYDIHNSPNLPTNSFHFPSTLAAHVGPVNYFTDGNATPTTPFVLRYYVHGSYEKDPQTQAYCEFVWSNSEGNGNFAFTVNPEHHEVHYKNKLGVTVIMECGAALTELIITPLNS